LETILEKKETILEALLDVIRFNTNTRHGKGLTTRIWRANRRFYSNIWSIRSFLVHRIYLRYVDWVFSFKKTRIHL